MDRKEFLKKRILNNKFINDCYWRERADQLKEDEIELTKILSSENIRN
jgi:hypothetical protein